VHARSLLGDKSARCLQAVPKAGLGPNFERQYLSYRQRHGFHEFANSVLGIFAFSVETNHEAANNVDAVLIYFLYKWLQNLINIFSTLP